MVVEKFTQADCGVIANKKQIESNSYGGESSKPNSCFWERKCDIENIKV